MNFNKTDEIKKTIEDVLQMLTVSFDDVEQKDEGFGLVFTVKTNHANLLIGSDGSHLLALNHVIKRIMEKKRGSAPRIGFTVDVNNYQRKRNEELKSKVLMLAERVRSFHRNMDMDPMSPYERMVIHAILLHEDEVETESVGIGRERHVVIKYKDNSNSATVKEGDF